MALRDYIQDSMSEIRRARERGGTAGMIGSAIRQGAGATIAASDAVSQGIRKRIAPVGTVARFAAGEPSMPSPNVSPVQNAVADASRPVTPTPFRQPDRPVTPTPTPTQPKQKQTAFTNADAQQYVGQDQTYTPLSERMASLNRGIDAFKDLGEYKEAASLGISQERYQQQKDIRQFGKDNAARLAEQRRGIIGALAANEPARRAQEIGVQQAVQLQDIFQQMATETDPAKIQRLYATALAMQGKEATRPKYTTIQDKVQLGTDISGNPIFGEQTVGTLEETTGAVNRFDTTPKPAVQTIDSQEEYDALPSGATYIDKQDGKTYRKP